MTYDRFLEIKEQHNGYEFNTKLEKITLFNVASNVGCYRARFNSKGTENEKTYFRWLIDDFNYNGNTIFANTEGILQIACFIKCDVFTEYEWKQILPHIFFEDFNRDYEKLEQDLAPMLGKIYRWRKDLHLEFWQGIFSFNTHWATKGLTPKDSINSPQNGDLYCDTLLEMYPIMANFLRKHPYAQYTLLNRLS